MWLALPAFVAPYDNPAGNGTVGGSSGNGGNGGVRDAANGTGGTAVTPALPTGPGSIGTNAGAVNGGADATGRSADQGLRALHAVEILNMVLTDSTPR